MSHVRNFCPKLALGATIVADNMTHPEMGRPVAQAYQRSIRGRPRIRSIFLPVGTGIEISRNEN
jgi:predicted O-methyltransferase YrrM